MRAADRGGVAGEAGEEQGAAAGLTWWVFEKRRRASWRRAVLIHLSPTARAPASHACTHRSKPWRCKVPSSLARAGRQEAGRHASVLDAGTGRGAHQWRRDRSPRRAAPAPLHLAQAESEQRQGRAGGEGIAPPPAAARAPSTCQSHRCMWSWAQGVRLRRCLVAPAATRASLSSKHHGMVQSQQSEQACARRPCALLACCHGRAVEGPLVHSSNRHVAACSPACPLSVHLFAPPAALGPQCVLACVCVCVRAAWQAHPHKQS